MKKTWILAAAMAVGIPSYLAVPSFALADSSDARQVDLNDTPDAVQRRITRERGNGGQVTQVERFNRNGESYYRARVLTANNRTVILHMDSRGEMLDAIPAARDRDNDRSTRDRDNDRTTRDRDNDRGTRDNRDRDTIRRERGTRTEVDVNGLPGPVAEAVGKEARSDKPIEAIKIVRSGQPTLYRVLIKGDTTSRYVYVNASGEKINVLNATDEGKKRVEYDDLPGEVKSALAQDKNNIRSIVQVTQGHRTYYRATVEDREGRNYIYLDGSGREIDDPTEEDSGTRNRDRDRR